SDSRLPAANASRDLFSGPMQESPKFRRRQRRDCLSAFHTGHNRTPIYRSVRQPFVLSSVQDSYTQPIRESLLRCSPPLSRLVIAINWDWTSPSRKPSLDRSLVLLLFRPVSP